MEAVIVKENGPGSSAPFLIATNRRLEAHVEPPVDALVDLTVDTVDIEDDRPSSPAPMFIAANGRW